MIAPTGSHQTANPATDQTGAVPLSPIYDRIARAKKMVDPTAYEAERAGLGRLLRYLMKAIPEDAKTILEEYPFEEVKTMYAEAMEALGKSATYYSKGDLYLAGVWVREAKKYADIEIKAHKIFMGQSVWSYVGKRVGLAVIGIFEGAANSLLGLVDMGAGLVGANPGLVEWNTQRYNTIKGGYTSATGLDHTLVSDDELGRFGGMVAGGLALGGGIAKAAQGGSVAAQFLMFTQVGGGIRMTVDGIGVMRGQGKSWGEIFSDPAVIAQIAGSVAGVAGIGTATVPALRDVLNQLGLVATAAQLSGMTATLVKIQTDTTLTDEQRQQQFLDATANLIVAVGLTADQQYGARTPAAKPEATGQPTARPPTLAPPERSAVPDTAPRAPLPKPSVHERFDLSDTPAPTQPAPKRARVGGGRVGGADNDRPTAPGDKKTTTQAAPHDADAVTDIGDTIEPPVPASVPAEYSAGSAKAQAAQAGIAMEILAAAAGEVTAVMNRAGNKSVAVSERMAAAQRTISRLEKEAATHTRRAADAADAAETARSAGDQTTERLEAKVAQYNANQARKAAAEATRLSLAAQIDGVNPTGSTDNCGHVIEAVEARLNGTNPDAQARAGGNLYLGSKPREDGLRHDVSIGEQYDGSFDPSTEPQVAANLAGRGEGAQGVVFVEWLGADGKPIDIGHFFHAVYKNGSVYYLDGHSGNVATSFGELFPGQRIGAVDYMPIERR